MRRTGAWLLAAALLAPGLGDVAAAGPLVAAHRGGAALWPENSLIAFGSALALGADLVETDVHLTADGEVVILHDATLDRTTTGHGPVRNAKRADLGSLHLRGANGAVTDEVIPPLTVLLDLLRLGQGELLLEIKVGADRRPYPGIEEKVLALLRARDLVPRVLVMAFEPETLRRVRTLDPTVRTVLLVGRQRSDRAAPTPADLVRSARQAGATHLGLDHRLVEGGVVAAARQAGLGVAAWTVNEEADLRRVIGLGVDVVISDRPDVALRLTGRR